MSDSLTIKTNLVSEIEEIDNDISEKQKIANRYRSLERLMSNPDFIDVVLNGYLKENAEKVFVQLTLPSSYRTISKDECEEVLSAVRSLNKYIGVDNFVGDLYYDGTKAIEDIKSLNEYKKQIAGK